LLFALARSRVGPRCETGARTAGEKVPMLPARRPVIASPVSLDDY